MPDKILLEDASGGIQLEDASGVLLIERYVEPFTADGMTTSDTTPSLEFTGLDPESHRVRYQIQVAPHPPGVVDSYQAYEIGGGLVEHALVSFDNYGQSFKPTATIKVGSVRFILERVGSPTGNVTAEIYAHTGTYGAGGTGTGTVLATSNAVDITTIPTVRGWFEFTFSGANQITLTADTPYVVVVSYPAGASGTDTIRVYKDDVSLTHAGNAAGFWSGWQAHTVFDVPFLVEATTTLDKVSGETIDEYREEPPGTHQFSTTVFDIGQSITGDGRDLDAVMFNLKKTGTPTGNMTARLYAHSGTFGTSSVGTGSALATSDPVAATVPSTSLGPIVFKFSTPYTLVNGTKYVVTVHHEESGDFGNYVTAGFKSEGTHAGNYAWATETGAWTADAGIDTPFSAITYPDSGFANTVTVADYDPFISSEKVSYTVQSALTPGTWYWRSRGKDPFNNNVWSEWTEVRDFTISAGTTYNQEVSGALGFSGSLAKDTRKTLTGALGFAGVTTKTGLKNVAGSLSFSGAVQKRAEKLLAGALSFSGVVSSSRVVNKAVDGTLSFAGSLAKTPYKALSGAVSFTGSLSKRTDKPLSGAVSFAGALVKKSEKALSGSVSFAGQLLKMPGKVMAGELSFSGVVTTVKSFTKSLAGELSFSGGFRATALKSLAGSLSFTGAVNKRLTKLFFSLLSFGQYSTYTTAVLADSPKLYLKLDDRDAGLTAADSSGNGHDGTYHTDTVTRHGAHGSQTSVRGAIGQSYALTVGHHTDFDVTAAMVELWFKIAGSSTKVGHTQLYNKRSGASEDFGANLYSFNGTRWDFVFPFGLMGSSFLTIPSSIKTDKELWVHVVVGYSQSIVRAWVNGVSVGSYTPSGAWNANRAFPLEISKDTGSYIDEFSFYNFYDDTLPARHYQAMFENRLTKMTSKFFLGGVSFSGTLAAAKRAALALAASLGFSGNLVKTSTKPLAGAVGFSGELVERANKNFTAAVSFSSSLIKTTYKNLVASVGFSGNLIANKLGDKIVNMASSLSFSGSLSKTAGRSMTAALGFNGALSRTANKALAGAVSFSGALSKMTPKVLAGALSFAGALRTMGAKALSGSVSFSGNLRKQAQKYLAGSVSFSGALKTFWVWVQIKVSIYAVYLTMTHRLGALMGMAHELGATMGLNHRLGAAKELLHKMGAAIGMRHQG